jgi:hypothetical protein
VQGILDCILTNIQVEESYIFVDVVIEIHAPDNYGVLLRHDGQEGIFMDILGINKADTESRALSLDI